MVIRYIETLLSFFKITPLVCALFMAKTHRDKSFEHIQGIGKCRFISLITHLTINNNKLRAKRLYGISNAYKIEINLALLRPLAKIYKVLPSVLPDTRAL